MKKTYLHYDTKKKTFQGSIRAVNRKRDLERKRKLFKKLRKEADKQLKEDLEEKTKTILDK